MSCIRKFISEISAAPWGKQIKGAAIYEWGKTDWLHRLSGPTTTPSNYYRCPVDKRKSKISDPWIRTAMDFPSHGSSPVG
uniref:Uncharacterized protein n=1 Tax=Aegilops tauschii subsp. strangulata TaxID=200361 RepID=A0A453JWH5_AEGTS